MSKNAILAILDGWGLGLDPKVSAIAQANTPFIDSCLQKYPHSKLEASGLAVGLLRNIDMGGAGCLCSTRFGVVRRH